MNSLPVSFWLKIFKYSNTYMCFAFNGFLAQCAKCSQTKYLHPHSMNWLFSVNLSNICKLGPHFVPIWSPFLLPNVPIWSPFHSKLGLHLVPIFKNLGPHSMWEQCPWVLHFHCSHMEWGPNFFKMGTQWGPNLEWNGDQMGTFGSRNGDQMGTKWGPKNRIFYKLTETS